MFISSCLLLFCRFLCSNCFDGVGNLGDNSVAGLSLTRNPTGGSSIRSNCSNSSSDALLKSSSNVSILPISSLDRPNLFKSNLELNSFNPKKDILKNEIHKSLRFYRQPASQRTNYVIIASGLVVPSSVYRIVVNLLEASEPIKVNASISRKSGGFEIGSEEFTVAPQSSEFLQIKVCFCF